MGYCEIRSSLNFKGGLFRGKEEGFSYENMKDGSTIVGQYKDG